MGIAMPASRRPMGCTPILFSRGAALGEGVFSSIVLSFLSDLRKKDAASAASFFRVRSIKLRRTRLYFFSSPVASWVR